MLTGLLRWSGLTDIAAHGGTRVDGDDDAMLKDEAQSGGAVARLDHLNHLALKLVHLLVPGISSSVESSQYKK